MQALFIIRSIVLHATVQALQSNPQAICLIHANRKAA